MDHPLSELRRNAGISQAELASQTGCEASLIADVEAGATAIPLDLAVRCGALFGIDAADLLTAAAAVVSGVESGISPAWARRVLAAVASDVAHLSSPRPVALTGDIIAYFLLHPGRSWELELYERRHRTLAREPDSGAPRGPLKRG